MAEVTGRSGANEKEANGRRWPAAGRALRIATVAFVLPVAGCTSVSGVADSVTSIFEEEEERLPGERISVVSPGSTSSIANVETARPVSVSDPQTNAAWSQPGGIASNAPGHLAFGGGLSPRWQVDIGAGSSSDGQLIAKPVVVGNRVFTIDTEGTVRAFSRSSGSELWERPLVPENEDEEAGFGGGLALADGKLFAATGFGTVVALDPSSGKPLWSKRFELPFRMSPTAVDGRIFVVNAESQLFCLSTKDGSELWTARGLPEAATILSNASPAVSGDTVVVPYPSGELLAFDIEKGQPKWAESLTRTRPGLAAQEVGDTARPAIAGGTVYAVSGAGRLIATDIESGSRRWSLDVSGSQTPWVAGDAVFVVDRSGKLVAVERDSGEIAWVSDLPPARHWNGPVLAGGKLWLISSKGLMLGVNARTGEVATKRDLDTGVYIAPVVADGQMYVLTDGADLIALN
ncbi:PQQ-binding-like beta-propeller repeat protein [Dichotomicrobium thermohalophilum]|uniref:Outer membrane protein assembly factor BamB n=1 Tax=Dichotomicrobium thermohalophilum TaxID=933063 RepID=A0A397QEZ3_9HYPH|nr:PQQ-binding-like beta-propeller repeat protein [Dichotomicrobium thermohalophilum]RIA56624.1 outer membrane protein assembly factor BamB [Dichotomicrobium thermohalophilum]